MSAQTNRPEAHKFVNALARETSPYLLQHAHNPVNWHPWNAEAFELARREDKPVFLSVGYSSCHWCHVMERESFEDESVARLLNENFIAVKVDREERPDIDEIYMAAVQVLTMSGGWPMSVFLAPDGRPFFGGTYFPKNDHPARAGFMTILQRIAELWRTRRADLLDDAGALSEAVREHLARGRLAAEGALDRGLLRHAVRSMRGQFDPERGGFARRPKFPPANALLLLLELQRQNPDDDGVREMTTLTLDQMARGGIYDHLAGGFHRYSTDEKWLVPHFEKMLYDNALLARCYAEASAVYANDAYAQTARATLDWVLSEMTSPEGAFYSALDADSEGEEGKFCLWSRGEAARILGADAGVFCSVYNIAEGGNFRDEASGEQTGLNILHITEPLERHAARLKTDAQALRRTLDGAKARLLAVRGQRPQPFKDDKILTAWNALMISAFARGATLLKEPRYLEAAVRAAEFLLGKMRTPEGRWLAVHRNGQSKLPAYLDDHAFLALAFLDLFEASANARWKDEALALAGLLNTHFADTQDGGYFFTADDHEVLLARVKDPLDRAIPSGNGCAAQALVRLAELTGGEHFRTRAAASLKTFQGLMERAPEAMAGTLLALALQLRGAPLSAEADSQRQEAAPLAVRGPVTAELLAGHSVFRAGTKVPVAVRLKLDSGWHVHATEKPGGAAALSIQFTNSALGEPGDWVWPAPERADGAEVYSGEFVIGAMLAVPAEASPGRRVLQASVRVQPCTAQSCGQPEVIALSLPADVAGAEASVSPVHEAVFRALKAEPAR